MQSVQEEGHTPSMAPARRVNDDKEEIATAGPGVKGYLGEGRGGVVAFEFYDRPICIASLAEFIISVFFESVPPLWSLEGGARGSR